MVGRKSRVGRWERLAGGKVGTVGLPRFGFDVFMRCYEVLRQHNETAAYRCRRVHMRDLPLGRGDLEAWGVMEKEGGESGGEETKEPLWLQYRGWW